MQTRVEIRSLIKKWLNDVFRNSDIPVNIIALNFHIQRTNDEFEIFLTGHDDFYFDHDTWLLSEVYRAKENFKGLGIGSKDLSDKEMYDIYKNEVNVFLMDNLKRFPENIHYFNCRYPAGIPELLIER